MRYVEVKGLRVPVLGFGTYRLAGAVCEHMVATALGIGYRHIDTARMYANEAEVGRAIETSGIRRDDIFLTTKILMTDLAYDAVQRSVEDSLRKLRTGHVDLVLIHWPNPEIPLEETLRALREIRERGLARAIGVSNFPVRLLREAIETHGADLLCDQVEYHPLLSQRPVLDYVRSRGMMLTAYSPLAQGRIADEPVLVEIARSHAKTPAQVALRWLVEQDGVAAIPKSASERRARENFAIFDFELTEDDRSRIDRLRGAGRLVDPGWAPDWDAP